MAEHQVNDDALVRAVTEAGGRVHVGFNNPDTEPMALRRIVTAEGLKVPIGPVTKESIEAGRALVRELGGEIDQEYRDFPMIVATIPTDAAVPLREHPVVDYVEPVTSGEPTGSPQFVPPNLDQIRVPEAWALSNGSGVRITFMDTGVAEAGIAPHPDLPALAPYAARCTNTVQVPPPGDDCRDLPQTDSMYGHGTAAAGIVLAKDDTNDIKGIAYGAAANCSMIRVCESDRACTSANIQAALLFVSGNGVDEVVNMSVTHGNNFMSSVNTAAAAAYAAGDLLIGAAGNSPLFARYPAAYSSVIAVSGVDSADVIHPQVRPRAPY